MNSCILNYIKSTTGRCWKTDRSRCWGWESTLIFFEGTTLHTWKHSWSCLGKIIAYFERPDWNEVAKVLKGHQCVMGALPLHCSSAEPCESGGSCQAHGGSVWRHWVHPVICPVFTSQRSESRKPDGSYRGVKKDWLNKYQTVKITSPSAGDFWVSVSQGTWVSESMSQGESKGQHFDSCRCRGGRGTVPVIGPISQPVPLIARGDCPPERSPPWSGTERSKKNCPRGTDQETRSGGQFFHMEPISGTVPSLGWGAVKGTVPPAWVWKIM